MLEYKTQFEENSKTKQRRHNNITILFSEKLALSLYTASIARECMYICFIYAFFVNSTRYIFINNV